MDSDLPAVIVQVEVSATAGRAYIQRDNLGRPFWAPHCFCLNGRTVPQTLKKVAAAVSVGEVTLLVVSVMVTVYDTPANTRS